MRGLKANEVEARIGTVSKQGKGLSLLLYKDARADMTILDELYGPFGWQREHEFKDGKLYCRVGIWDEKKEQWVWKEDVGSPSNMEADKGQASDSFKRACTNWGIGRELYTAPFIWIGSDRCQMEQYNGKWTCRDRFFVRELESENGVIRHVQIVNQKGQPVFDWTAR